MQRDEYIAWLKDWFQRKIGSAIESNDSNFFVSGILDSFSTLELITDLEQSFQLNFSETHLSDPRFSSINGLATMMIEIKNPQGETVHA